MLEKEKISGLQMAILIYYTVIATGILLVPTITSQYAGHDMWLSPVIASITGIITLVIANKLNKLNPSLTFFENLERILGRFLGKFICLLYLLFYLQICGITLREYGEFVVGTFLQLTPLSAVMGSMVFVCATAVRGGVEVIARTGQLFIPLFLFLFFIIVVLLIPDLDFMNIFPVFEKGIKPLAIGAVTPQSWYSEIFVIAFLLPNLKKGDKTFVLPFGIAGIHFFFH